MKKVSFFIPYPLKKSPSQRFRFEQYFLILKNHSVSYTIYPFLSSRGWAILYTKGKSVEKGLNVLIGLSLRILHVLYSIHADYVFIHREAAPIGPPIFEWIIAKVLQKKIIYDFDDAIWLTDRKSEPWYLRKLKWRKKVERICSWSYKVSCGNKYLCEFAQQFNKNVIYNPTTIDTEFLHNRSLYKAGDLKENNRITIGWTGSHSTLKYLNQLEPILIDLEKKYSSIEFWVIADKPSNVKLRNLRHKPWSLETEIKDLAQFDIGLMPLPNDEWAKGKCGFKALQYMALEIPTIVSPVGVNTAIIDHQINGFLAANQNEWFWALEQLIIDSELRKKIGKKGRETVITHYSVASNSSTFLSLFDLA